MPQVKFDRIVSCSSEDPAHPSKNLLLSRDYNRKWKCKTPGEETATVIIQLTEPQVISSIDIGNESSSFVEVLVSRSSTPDDFQVLLVMSSFMTPMDARSETNRNRVRMFSPESLSDPIRKEKWDRIKVVCTQPFNKHLQYGLSFIVLHTTESKQEVSAVPMPSASTLGRFALKDENESDISVGSFFSRRKDLQTSPPRPVLLTGAAAVRDAASPANLAEQKAAKKRKGSEDLSDSQKKKRGRPKKDSTDSPSTDNAKAKMKNNGSPSLADNKPKKNIAAPSGNDKRATMRSVDSEDDFPTVKTKVDKRKASDTEERHKVKISDNDAGPSSSSHNSSQNNQLNQKQSQGVGTNVTYKPFNKLFEGVGISLSGYVNPERTHIRDKALAMGSKYSNEWVSSSTHLICAFLNTPKYSQVKGKGIIVTRDWIDDCFQERKRLPWRRYALDKHERKDAGSGSEPEVWELIPDLVRNNDSPLPPVSRRNDVATQDTRLKSDSEDSESEIERIKAKQALKKKNLEEKTKKTTKLSSPINLKKVKKGSESSDSEDEIERIKVKQQLKKNKLDENIVVKNPERMKGDLSQENEAYNCSTDVDSEEEAKRGLEEWSDEQKNALELPPLPDFFKDKMFFLSRDFPETERKSLSRYIVAFGGEVLQSEDKSTHYLVSTKKYKLPEGSKSVHVTPEWIWQCNDSQRLIPAILFEPD